MQISRADVADLIYFMAIARHRSFSRAAIELGVSASALSHALKGLETRLGVRLLNRTTKSVTPTAAGEELVQSVLQPFDTIEGALESLNRYRNTPTGRIRINAAVEAANLLLAPVMPAFMDRYPDIEIDIVASNRMVDVTDAGFDAGIRYGGTVPEDMVARRLSADIRWVIAASLITWNATERLNIRMIYYTIAASAIVSVTIGFIAGSACARRRNIPNDSARLSDGQSCRNGSGGRIGRGWPNVFSGASCCTLCQGWTAPSGAYGMVPTGGRFSYLLFKPPAIADRASPSD